MAPPTNSSPSVSDLAGIGMYLAAVILLPLLAGVWVGARIFKHADPESFRRWVLRILALLAVLTAAQGAVQMFDLLPG